MTARRPMHFPTRLILAAALLAPASIEAQSDAPVGQLPINYQVRATLIGAATRFRNAPAHYWVLTCPPGTTFQLDVVAVWDAWALVTTEHGMVLAEDDNTRGDPNAKITYTCPGGMYRLVVSTRIATSPVGDYKLTLRAVETPGSVVQQPLPPGMPEPLILRGSTSIADVPATRPSLPAPGSMPPAATFNPLPFDIRTTRSLGRMMNYEDKKSTLGPSASSYHNHLVDPWTWQCAPAREVTFTLRSEVADQLIVFDARGREIARAEYNTEPQTTRLVLQCTDAQLITVGVMSRTNTPGEYTLHAQARTHAPPAGR
jgi:hypothetical protein